MQKMYDYEKEHLARMRELAPECMVLLKKDGRFPLAKAGEIALYGSGARCTVKGGTGSGDVNSRFYVTVEQGLREAGFTVTSDIWLNGYDAVRAEAKKKFIADIKAQARKQHKMAILVGMGAVMPEPEYALPLDAAGDTALYVLARNSGEGNDRKPAPGDMCLTETEIRDILAANAKYENFMLVLNVGGVVDLSPVKDVKNILILSQLGAVTGQALADVVLGKAAPSGKLTTTWSAWEDYAAIGNFADPDDTDYKEGVYVGYRYFDSVGKAPMYPFGFGLGYADFAVDAPAAEIRGTQVTVRADVTNIGTHPGKEVVQVYVSAPWGKLDQPYQTLAGFAKTGILNPGERETVTVSFCMEEIAGYDMTTAAYILEKGSYIVRVGSSSRDTIPAAVLELPETVSVRCVSHVGGEPGFADWKPRRGEEALPDVPVLAVDPAAFAALSWPVPAQVSPRAKEITAALTDEQAARVCVGHFSDKGGIASVIGSASVKVPGAAGETCGTIDGVPGLVMADGPAGLRLTQQYFIGKNGPEGIGSGMPAGFEDYFGPVIQFILGMGKKKPKGEIRDQYCTAIPIGTALAQSWNTELCEVCGRVVGEEMERFGVHLWLAPAFNIHRSPLCGRNFEYYSEDPLICGKIAAAITRGVQSKPGRGTTIKHFCCNNQETERYTCSSNLSERALREIYIRGFEICIREANPAAVMTSYNLLNGIHTSEREDLMKTLIREEWGYDGLIMTDWVIGLMGAKGKYRMAKAAPTVKAGNDVFMPGGPGDYRELLAALQGKDPNFAITRKEIDYCAEHVIDLALRMGGKS